MAAKAINTFKTLKEGVATIVWRIVLFVVSSVDKKAVKLLQYSSGSDSNDGCFRRS